jgi:hypothetical protein
MNCAASFLTKMLSHRSKKLRTKNVTTPYMLFESTYKWNFADLKNSTFTVSALTGHEKCRNLPRLAAHTRIRTALDEKCRDTLHALWEYVLGNGISQIWLKCQNHEDLRILTFLLVLSKSTCKYSKKSSKVLSLFSPKLWLTSRSQKTHISGRARWWTSSASPIYDQLFCLYLFLYK